MARDRKVGCCWMVALALLAFAGGAGTARAADLLDVYELALDDDPELRRAYHDQLAARERVTQALSSFLPSVSVEAELGGTRQNIRSSNNELFSEGSSFFQSRRLTVTLNQSLYRQDLIASYKQAGASVRQSEMEFEGARQDLVLRVAVLYFEALSAQDGLAFAEAERLALTQHYELARLQRARGLASLTDLYDARARLAAVEALAIEAEDAYDDAFQALRELNPDVPAHLEPLREIIPLQPPSPGDLESWVVAALDANADLGARQEAVTVARYEVTRQKSVRIPALDFVARGNRERTGGTVFGGGNDIETANLLVRLTVPIYQGGVINSRIRQARQTLYSAEEAFERTERSVRREVRGAYYGVTRAISRVEALREGVRAQESALDARREGYRSGRYSTLDVLDAERDLFEARRDHARARYDYILNSLRLKRAVGTLDETALGAINGWLD